MLEAATDNKNALGKRPLLSIVVPVYNEQDAVVAFVDKICAVTGLLDASVEIVFVDDGSSDATVPAIRSIETNDLQIRLLVLSRNFGKEAALAAGLAHAAGDAAIPMDVDLQDCPDVIPEMVDRWQAGAKIVDARRVDRRSDSFFKRRSARLYYWLFNRLAEYPIPVDVGDFRLIDRQVLDILNQMGEKARFNKDLFSWVGFAREEVTFERQSRSAGATKWKVWKLWNFALDGIFGSSTAPLRVWGYVGFCLAGLAFIYAAFILVRTLAFGIDTPGYASTVILILFFGGLNLLSLGILGEYVGRIYREVRDRPLYIVEKIYPDEGDD